MIHQTSFPSPSFPSSLDSTIVIVCICYLVYIDRVCTYTFAHWWSSFVVELFGAHHAAFSGRFPEGLVQQHCAMATRVTGASTLGPNQAQTVTTFAEDPRVQLRDQAATPPTLAGSRAVVRIDGVVLRRQVHREICLQIWAFGDKNIHGKVNHSGAWWLID